MIKGVVFDLDGTLIDTSRMLSLAWADAFKENGFDISQNELYDNARGISAKELVKRYVPEATESLTKKLIEKRGEEVVKHLEDPLFYPETVEVLIAIRNNGIKIAIATGLAEDLLKEIVKATAIDRLVDTIVSADAVATGKPDPAVFIEAFRRIRVKPKDGMVIGDSYNDISPAKRIGSFSVFISRDGKKLDEADTSINNLKELSRILNLK